MTIKERAKEYADQFTNGDSSVITSLIHNVAKDSYLAGYNQAVDKACEWMEENLIGFVEYDGLNGIEIDYGQLYKQFRKAMEESV